MTTQVIEEPIGRYRAFVAVLRRNEDVESSERTEQPVPALCIGDGHSHRSRRRSCALPNLLLGCRDGALAEEIRPKGC